MKLNRRAAMSLDRPSCYLTSFGGADPVAGAPGVGVVGRGTLMASPRVWRKGFCKPTTTLSTPQSMSALREVSSPWQSPVSRLRYAVLPRAAGPPNLAAWTSTDSDPCICSHILSYEVTMRPTIAPGRPYVV
jgi:hypothetical protein